VSRSKMLRAATAAMAGTGTAALGVAVTSVSAHATTLNGEVRHGPAKLLAAGGSELTEGQDLTAGQDLVSPNGTYTLDMQTDGNLVEYKGSSVLFDTNTAGQPGNYLAMQSDGNLVLYNSGGAAVWNTATYGYDGAYVSLQNDDNLVVYKNSTALWAQSWTQTPAGAQAYSQILFPHYSWSVSAQYTCLDDLWNQESGWEWNATNSSSGAYGIPQSLPADKMASAGSDWQTDGETQVQWGELYIDQVYGTPCAAWAHEEEYGWYAPNQPYHIPG
jgi:hypothetical protein